MVTASTSDWRLDVDGLLDEAWARVRRVVGREQSAKDLERGLRAVPLLFQELTVRGVELWRVDRREVSLTAGQPSYPLQPDTQDVLECVLYDPTAVNRDERLLHRLGRTQYLALPDKLSVGTPLQYWLDRQREGPVLWTWPVPPADTQLQIGYQRVRAFRDVNSPLDLPDAPPRWMPCLVSGLAWLIAMGTEGVDSAELLGFEARWEKDYLAAVSDDRERLPFRVEYDLSSTWGD